MLSTKPTGPRTGYSNPECYARALGDCSEEITREHYISKKLLERLGRSFTSEGLAWQTGAKRVSPKSLRAWMLCKRHNHALSPLDDKITELYDLLRRWYDRKPVGDHVLDGEDIERWAVKVMLGFLVSGNARNASGGPGKLIDVPETYLRVLFGDEDMPAGRGFFYTNERPPNARPNGIAFWPVGYTPEEKGGAIFGFGLSLLGFTWVTTVLGSPSPPHYYYRPIEFVIGGTGRLRLRWEQPPAEGLIVRLFGKHP